jgi:hypothetical protein
MQRFLLLLLAVSLGISIFVCSQQGIQQPISDSEIAQVISKEIQPFYFVALPFQGPYENEELVRERFFQELAKQEISITDTLFYLYYNNPSNVPVNQLQWAIAAPLPDSVRIEYPLVVSKWNYPSILSIQVDDPTVNSEHIERIFEKYLVEKGLLKDSSISEIIFSDISSISDIRERWYLVSYEQK